MTEKIDRWKAMQASMAIEGYEISDSMLAEMKVEYEAQGRNAEVEGLMDEAKKSGRSILEVAREFLAKKRR